MPVDTTVLCSFFPQFFFICIEVFKASRLAWTLRRSVPSTLLHISPPLPLPPPSAIDCCLPCWGHWFLLPLRSLLGLTADGFVLSCPWTTLPVSRETMALLPQPPPAFFLYPFFFPSGSESVEDGACLASMRQTETQINACGVGGMGGGCLRRQCWVFVVFVEIWFSALYRGKELFFLPIVSTQCWCDQSQSTLKSTIKTPLTLFDAIRVFEYFFSPFAAAFKCPGWKSLHSLVTATSLRKHTRRPLLCFWHHLQHAWRAIS